MKKVIVACGSGVATSQTVASKVKSILEENGVRASVEAVDIKSLDQYIKTSDVYISITKNTKEYDIPTLNGIAFLTGMGMEEETQKLLDALK
ncbi:PTS galactitol transporter subunit IIB [Virgibacillus pantothenticus]|jgi:galactitol PTS system EIIB component|uniref:PTS galactitol transporter subunit IIB n=1 Tax=Virgibacillus pantothenticus TaxID=1473 RepID=A0A0L0QLE8_VIRPA|nr:MULTISPECIES: PTS sugar transporter subunit IIB [Virgibacillus]API93161.1 PTS galactitol transporter subunit IIB [Virgibacillus sp. 6R]KNE19450.1 PTS galactitol transporter subunit IIB [Virgibacillus pantothenticus]MBS7428796.1 PTS sugar transporter subunit IIB [Virgibacillus sp. 19R1-5]MBU8568793.1 PTS sugar transporter subunit IIB [Virgibacillus pantothenticus]MBU8602859.1 PTS sugar transporter subunit IIB [Virgibacillus pantothenticus]